MHRDANKLLESRIPMQSSELRLDPRTCCRERRLVCQRPLQKRESRLRVAAHRMNRGRVVPRKRVVRTEPHAALERLQSDVEQRVRLVGVAEREMRATQSGVQLHEN